MRICYPPAAPALISGAVLAAALAVAAPAAASEADLTDCLIDAWQPQDCIGFFAEPCVAREGETTAAMISCIDRETGIWQSLLDASYERLLAASQALDESAGTVSPELSREATLRQAQTAWAAFRDAECTMQGARWGQAALRPVAEGNCRMAQTAERVFTLLSFLES